MFEMVTPQPTEEKPIEVNNYPYGFSMRTRAQWWIETTKRGQRVCFRTLNPKTDHWNRVKKSTYSDIKIITRNTENGYIENDGLTFAYADEDSLQAFLKQFPEDKLTEYQQKKIKVFRAIIKTRKHFKYTCVDNPSPEKVKEIEANDAKAMKCAKGLFHHYLNEELGEEK